MREKKELRNLFILCISRSAKGSKERTDEDKSSPRIRLYVIAQRSTRFPEWEIHGRETKERKNVGWIDTSSNATQPFLSNGYIRKFDDARRDSYADPSITMMKRAIMNEEDLDNRRSNHLLSIRDMILIFVCGTCSRWKFLYFSNYRIMCAFSHWSI